MNVAEQIVRDSNNNLLEEKNKSLVYLSTKMEDFGFLKNCLEAEYEEYSKSIYTGIFFRVIIKEEL